MKPGAKIRILIVDDHFLVRMGLTAVVNMEPDMEVAGEAGDGAQAIDCFEKLVPDLTLMDLRMPGKDGIQATTEIRNKFPAARILMLTTFDGDEDIHKALQAGAQGYVLKNSTRETLIPALRTVAAGERWIPKDIASRLASRKTFEELTPREVEVLHKLARGLANKEIADTLGISEHTVKGHLKNILGKLRVADRTEAVTTAILRGIIHL
ncbi:MAG TPA: response regulator transcription factor [Verrucomicrobiae bacterium]|jgi:DNA-binding NarL/FixJ family response regulator|nr:response regulator transcription factor [Verrucomicrobiae bacterium]